MEYAKKEPKTLECELALFGKIPELKNVCLLQWTKGQTHNGVKQINAIAWFFNIEK